MFRPVYLALAACVLVITAGQTLFKLAAIQLKIDPVQPLTANLQDNARPIALVLLALALYFASTLAWVLSLRSVPLSLAFMFNAASFVLVPVAGFTFFGEGVPRFFWLGSMFIFAGLALILLPGTRAG